MMWLRVLYRPDGAKIEKEHGKMRQIDSQRWKIVESQKEQKIDRQKEKEREIGGGIE